MAKPQKQMLKSHRINTNEGSFYFSTFLASKKSFELLLNNYVLERPLYRLSHTNHRDRFILKGAMLLTKWFDDPLRPTRDLDLLGIGKDDCQQLAYVPLLCSLQRKSIAGSEIGTLAAKTAAE